MRRILLPLAAALAGTLVVAGCSTAQAAKKESAEEVYQLNLTGAATAEGRIVLNAPRKMEIKVAAGATALDVALQVRQELMAKGYTVLCVVDRSDQGHSILVKGKLAVSQDSSNLGGIGGSAGQVIQRREVIQSRVREYFRFVKDNNGNGMKQIVSNDFLQAANQELGKNIELVNMGTPVVGCNTASVIVETALAGGEHRQSEVQLVNDDNLRWKVAGVRDLAKWKGR
ncbi:MAG: hypothetical protein FJ039_04655 [Chloroflexi bacterium]|nr:hypothetical protein [Chloroflexota bacterium]